MTIEGENTVRIVSEIAGHMNINYRTTKNISLDLLDLLSDKSKLIEVVSMIERVVQYKEQNKTSFFINLETWWALKDDLEEFKKLIKDGDIL